MDRKRKKDTRALKPLDSVISDRNRSGRKWHFAYMTALFPLTTASTGALITGLAFLAPLPGFAIGASIGAIGFPFFAQKRLIIDNPATNIFVTIDTLKTLFGKRKKVDVQDGADDEKVYVVYGPGKHFSYFWEDRNAENNISLIEVSQEFTFELTTPDGTLSGEGSFRLRPRHDMPIEFLLGAAAVAEEISDLIVADIVEYLTTNKEGEEAKSVQQALQNFGTLNKHLLKQFEEDDEHQTLEERFGIDITDATVKKLLPSGDLQKTLSGISEMRAINQAVAESFGTDGAGLREMLRNNEVTHDQVNHVRDRVMAATGNLEGMEVDRKEYDINLHGDGISPELMKTLGEAINSPGGKALIASASKKQSPGKSAGGGKKSRGKQKRSRNKQKGSSS